MRENYLVGTDSEIAHYIPEIHNLSARDKNAIVQMLMTFSAAIFFATERFGSASVVETGSGFSTEILARLLLPNKKSSLTSLDLDSERALQVNSRGSIGVSTVQSYEHVSLVSKPTVSLEEVQSAWGLGKECSWDPLSLSEEHLSFVVDWLFDDRRLVKFEQATSSKLSPASLLPEVHKIKTGNQSLFNLWRYEGDEFDVLESSPAEPSLEKLLTEIEPNIVFLDSGEFSTLAEFLVVDRCLTEGSFLVVQDILFPKSVKGFLIAGVVSQSPKWNIHWLDRSTAQGMMIAEKIG